MHISRNILLGLFIGIPLSTIDTFMHELCHCLGIIFVKPKIAGFKENLWVKPKLLNTKIFFLKAGITKSNLLEYLELNKRKYPKEIRIIAISGTLFSSILYLALITTSAILSKYYLCGVFLFFIIKEILSFFLPDHKTSSDLYFFKNPQNFHYKYNKKGR